MKELVPGRSLGNVNIGDTRSKLLQDGFKSDNIRDSNHFLKHDNLLVRLEQDQAVQIWFEGNNLTVLSLRGKKLPKKKSAKSLKKFFRNCEPEVKGSGGFLIYCEDRGIELVFSFSGDFQGLSIITQSVAESVTGQPFIKKK